MDKTTVEAIEIPLFNIKQLSDAEWQELAKKNREQREENR